MGALLKNRMLNEERFFLNKSNTKWISVGILPGYHSLNGQKFSVEIKIGGDTGSVSLNENGLKSVISMLKSISYFAKFSTSDEPFEMERGILISEFQMGASPCYKIINQLKNTSVCIGMKSVEELLEMEELLWVYIKTIDVKAAEKKFLDIIDFIAVDGMAAFYQKCMENPDPFEMKMLINFNDFVVTCMELKKFHSVSPAEGEPSKPPQQEINNEINSDDDDNEPIARRFKKNVQ